MTRRGSAARVLAVGFALLVTVVDAEEVRRHLRPSEQDVLSARRLQALRDALLADGFDIRDGAFETFDVVRKVCEGTILSAEGNNAGAAYKTYRLPELPDQPAHNRLPVSYRMRPDEAIVLVALTPPPVDYFSYESFVIYSGSGASRLKYGFCIGDSVNNATVRTKGRTGHDPFNRALILVTTADRGVARRVRQAAELAGFPREIVNLDVIPSAVVKLGLDEDDDELVTLNRTHLALPGHERELAEYLGEPQGTLLRVTPREPIPADDLDPFPVPDLRVRGTGTTEMELLPGLERLRSAILAKHAGLTPTDLAVSIAVPDGFDPLQRRVFGWLPTRDTVYLQAEPFKLGPNELLVAYGVLHGATGKATYSSMSLYVDPPTGLTTSLFLGVRTVNDGSLAGSALDYLPIDDPAAPYLYAWKVARDCQGDPRCTEPTLDPALYPTCEALDRLADPFMQLAFRSYLEPRTKVGPAFTEILYDRVVKLTQP